MPKIHDIAQGDLDWLKLRIGKVTASELDNLVTPEFEVRKGEMPFTYLAKKIAEGFTGKPLPQFSTFDTEQGAMLEMEARGWFALENSHKVLNVGFVEHDSGRCGCSPDALLDEDGGLEIKAPASHTHVKYLMKDELPKDYAAQVHMSLYVTGRKWWKFISYHRGYPAFVLRVERDEAIMAKIDAALNAFYVRYDAAMETLRNKTN